MLAVSPLRNTTKNDMEGFSMEGNDFPDFSSGNLLDSIDFDDLFVGLGDGDLLPDLEMDPEILAEFSAISNNATLSSFEDETSASKEEEKAAASVSASDLGSGTSSLIQGDEIVSKRASNPSSSTKETEKGRGKSSSAQSKNPQGKRKVKVDWTPELHRRFVQAVEQLGVDKAVPSRILELMGIDCLTRHNIASHLQKYRSHRKHLLAREAEAANWSQRRHIYGGGGAPGKRDVNHWIAPTMGFPPVTPPVPAHFRPLHVWGHPSMDQSMMHTWPKHLSPTPPPPPQHVWPWPPAHPPPPNADPSFWHPHQHHIPTPGTAYFPPHVAQPRFQTPVPIAGIPPPLPHGPTLPQPPSDVHPSKESVDAAITDVLSKPWLPLPLGLKPPSTDSVMVELNLQGISKIPPTTNCA